MLEGQFTWPAGDLWKFVSPPSLPFTFCLPAYRRIGSRRGGSRVTIQDSFRLSSSRQQGRSSNALELTLHGSDQGLHMPVRPSADRGHENSVFGGRVPCRRCIFIRCTRKVSVGMLPSGCHAGPAKNGTTDGVLTERSASMTALKAYDTRSLFGSRT